MLINTGQTVTVKLTRLRMVQVVLLFGSLTAACGATLLLADGSYGMDPLARWIGGFGVLFFGAGGLFVIGRLWGQMRRGITLSPAGLHDPMQTREPVPWPAVRRFGVVGAENDRVIVLEIETPAATAAGMRRLPTHRHGITEIGIEAKGLTLKADDLFTLIEAYHKAHRRG
jgi:hypothetical protein